MSSVEPVKEPADDAAAAVLDDAPADLRRAFYRTLRHTGRAALADRLLPDVRARWGDREAAAPLPACSGAEVARWLPDLEHAVTAWRALAERVPGLRPWAYGVYDRLVARCGTEQLEDHDHYLDLVLPRGAEHALQDVLRPRLRAARGRRDPSLAIEPAWSLDRRAIGLAELQDDLRAGALDRSGDHAGDAAEVWLEDPAHRVERAARLVAADPAAIGPPAGRRTDLLGGVEIGERTPPVRPQDPGRWTPAQVERVRESLNGVAGDGALPADTRIAAVRSLGRLPGSLGDLAARAGGGDAVPAEAALEAMARTDRPAEALRSIRRWPG
ncbi:hypothetical protein [Actinomadura algeriensis]|uniref:Uncharacterized protein n=1 Tax=Actinomadura algeriensis TaxID=1679523 RepID=A0ABR9K089_9ACTN|nr:hypothetical protein [Actinomadura algeriensis]MBE1536043.1 hypothetical protein [Actinomadura algeriensis]